MAGSFHGRFFDLDCPARLYDVPRFSEGFVIETCVVIDISSRLGYLNCFLSYILTRTVAPPQSEAWEGRDCPWRPLCR